MLDAGNPGWPSGPEEPRTFRSMDGGVQVQTTALRPDRYSFFNTAPDGATSIARGGGLSFAAASFGAGEKSIDLGAFDRVLDYDPESGQVEVEAGITLEKLFRFLTPRGRYLPVQPGYGLIAVGGCIGCGVHGKNPARDGTFLSQVVSLRLFHPDHGIIALSSTEEPELFRATYAGFGMMGVIVSAVLRTRALAGWSTETTVHPVESASEVAALLPQIADKSDLAYGWLDCAWPRSSSFGRGLVLDIRFTAGGTPDITLPAGRLSPAYGRKLPICLLNRWSARAINLAHVYRSRRAVGPRVNGLPGKCCFRPTATKSIFACSAAMACTNTR